MPVALAYCATVLSYVKLWLFDQILNNISNKTLFDQIKIFINIAF